MYSLRCVSCIQVSSNGNIKNAVDSLTKRRRGSTNRVQRERARFGQEEKQKFPSCTLILSPALTYVPYVRTGQIRGKLSLFTSHLARGRGVAGAGRARTRTGNFLDGRILSNYTGKPEVANLKGAVLVQQDIRGLHVWQRKKQAKLRSHISSLSRYSWKIQRTCAWETRSLPARCHCWPVETTETY